MGSFCDAFQTESGAWVPCPVFFGSNLSSWLSSMEDFLVRFQIPEIQWVNFASYYVLGDAYSWVSLNKDCVSWWNWEQFTTAISEKFDQVAHCLSRHVQVSSITEEEREMAMDASSNPAKEFEVGCSIAEEFEVGCSIAIKTTEGQKEAQKEVQRIGMLSVVRGVNGDQASYKIIEVHGGPRKKSRKKEGVQSKDAKEENNVEEDVAMDAAKEVKEGDKQLFRDSVTLYCDIITHSCFTPDKFTFPSLLKSCGSSLCCKEGYQLHDHVIKMGLVFDLFISTTLVDMYVKFENMVSARKVFDEMHCRNQVAWTAMVVGYARSGDCVKSREVFELMPEKDTAAYNAMIDAYVKAGNVDFARELFDGMPERNVVSWTTLIDGYCKNGDLGRARSLFDAMPVKNLVSWNAMIGGYCQNKKPDKALELFKELQLSSLFQPDAVTIVSLLSAIADLGALDFGEWVHAYVKRKQLDRATNVCTALIDMFAKCGHIVKAEQVFNEIPNRETSSWNAMINGFAVNGYAKEALALLNEMLVEGVKPNEITMIGVLAACNHGGLVDEGKKWFESMKSYGITPGIEHYGCMVDILGRAGCLEEAEKLIMYMPYEVNGIILSSVLFACGCSGDVMRAEKFMLKAFEIEPWNDGNYVIMRNLYAGKKRWGDVEVMKGLMRKHKATSEAGCSVVEVGSGVCEFVAGDRVHPQCQTINLVLRHLWLHMKGEVTN